MKSERRVSILYLDGLKKDSADHFILTDYLELPIGSSRGSAINFPRGVYPSMPEAPAIIELEEGEDGCQVGLEVLDPDFAVFVNGERVQEGVYLASGETIQLGEGGPTFLIEVTPVPQEPPVKQKMAEGGASFREMLSFIGGFLSSSINPFAAALIVGLVVLGIVFFNFGSEILPESRSSFSEGGGDIPARVREFLGLNANPTDFPAAGEPKDAERLRNAVSAYVESQKESEGAGN